MTDAGVLRRLDDLAGYAAIDPDDALADVEATAAQWREALGLADMRVALDRVDAVVVAGMGGSGVAGDVVAALGADRLGVPLLVWKGYGLPAFVGATTLVLAASYSGNTEETLSAVDVALERGAGLAAVSSGGRLAELADEHGFPLVRVPGGGQPRHSLGYLAVPLLAALGLDEGIDEALAVQAEVAQGWGRDVPSQANAGKRLAARFADGTLPVLYGAQGLASVAALRLKCQLNENAKLPAFVGQLPELDHNDVVGWEAWSAATRRTGLIWVDDPEGDHARNVLRREATEAVIEDAFAWVETLSAVGDAPLARLASLLLKADLVSCYAALARGVDPTPVTSIDALKRELAQR